MAVQSKIAIALHPSPCRTAAQEVLDACIEGRAWPAARLDELLACAVAEGTGRAREGSNALFQVLAEGIADRFEPRLSDVYAEIFSRAIALAIPGYTSSKLVARYRRIRCTRRFSGDTDGVRKIFVLSRVTLGADIAVTSVLLDAVKRRFPAAEIHLAGGEKNWKLFAADPRLRWLPVTYGRDGTLHERLATGLEMSAAFSDPASIVIDPDSRLTQLGLLPVCPEERLFFFDSRSYGGDGVDSLAALASRWAGEVLGVAGAKPYIAPAGVPEAVAGPFVTVNLGVGENPAKRIPDPFEEELLRSLLRSELPIVLDLGGSDAEAERVRRAIRRCGAPESRLRAWQGPFAEFAALIAASRLYVGYDSAGQHAAAACGTPLVTVFAGFPSPRMLARWSPSGPGPKELVRVDRPEPRAVLDQTVAAVGRLATYTSRR